MSAEYSEWLNRMEEAKKKVVAIECGAGLVIPSARLEAEEVAERFSTLLVRINPTDYMAPTEEPVGIGIPLGSADALTRIWKRVEKLVDAGKKGRGGGKAQTQQLVVQRSVTQR